MIQEYIDLTTVCALTDYADKKSVRRHNKSVDRMHKIAEEIGRKQTTETIDDFTKLLDIDSDSTNVWAAVHILERIPVDKTTKQKALNIIKQIANGNSADAFGFTLWLKNYEKK